MKRFSGSKALSEAFRILSSRFAPMAAVAVLFLGIPGGVGNYYMADFQASAMGNPEGVGQRLLAMGGTLVGLYLVATLIQLAGYCALSAASSERLRLGIGDSIATGLRAMPTQLIATILFLIGYVVVLGGVMLLGPVLIATFRSAAVNFTWALCLFGLMIYLAVKFCLTLPVAVIEGERNPIAALTRSWQLTRGASFKIFLLMILFVVIYAVIALILLSTTIGTSFLSGAIPDQSALVGYSAVMLVVGGVAAMLFVSLITAIHDQLAGPGIAEVERTFA